MLNWKQFLCALCMLCALGLSFEAPRGHGGRHRGRLSFGGGFMFRTPRPYGRFSRYCDPCGDWFDGRCGGCRHARHPFATFPGFYFGIGGDHGGFGIGI